MMKRKSFIITLAICLVTCLSGTVLLQSAAGNAATDTITVSDNFDGAGTLHSTNVFEHSNVTKADGGNADYGLIPAPVWGEFVSPDNGYIVYKVKADGDKTLSGLTVQFNAFFGHNGLGEYINASRTNINVYISPDNANFTKVYDAFNASDYSSYASTVDQSGSAVTWLAEERNTWVSMELNSFLNYNSEIYIKIEFIHLSYDRLSAIVTGKTLPQYLGSDVNEANKTIALRRIGIRLHSVTITAEQQKVGGMDLYDNYTTGGSFASNKIFEKINVIKDTAGGNAMGLIPSAAWGGTVDISTGYVVYKLAAADGYVFDGLQAAFKVNYGHDGYGEQYNTTDIKVALSTDNVTYTDVYSIRNDTAIIAEGEQSPKGQGTTNDIKKYTVILDSNLANPALRSIVDGAEELYIKVTLVAPVLSLPVGRVGNTLREVDIAAGQKKVPTGLSAKIVDDKLNIELTDGMPDGDFQFWIKGIEYIHTLNSENNKTQAGEKWQLVKAFSSDNFAVVENYEQYIIDGYYNIIVRIKHGNTITHINRSVAHETLTPVVTSLTINGKDPLDVNYAGAGSSVDISAVFSIPTEFTLSDGTDETYTSENGKVSYTVKEGTNTLTLSSDSGFVQVLTLVGYNIFDNYVKIDSVSFEGYTSFGENVPMGQTSNLQVSTVAVGGETLPYSLSISVKGSSETPITENNYAFNIANFASGYGKYFYTIYVRDESGKLFDYFQSYYYYARTETAADMTVSKTQEDNKYIITASSPQNMGSDSNVVYRFYKWDAGGEYALTKWLEPGKDSLTLTLALGGSYRIEVRAKGAGAGEFEARKYVNIGTVTQSVQDVFITDYAKDSAADVVCAQNAYKVEIQSGTDAKLYKFIVSSYGQWKVEEYYSPENSFVWIPKKSGIYRIEVRILDYSNYGYADNISTTTITVQDGLEK